MDLPLYGLLFVGLLTKPSGEGLYFATAGYGTLGLLFFKALLMRLLILFEGVG